MAHAIPSPWVAVVLMLGTYRAWRILAADTLPILVKWREWLLRPLVWDEAGETPVIYDRPLLAEWLECPWCSGLWVSVAAYLLWLWTPDVLYIATPLAISAAVGVIRTKLD